jgi:hypothetical protein
MTRHKTLQCVHEPFGDAYYFGPERLAERYEGDLPAREESGYSESTYRVIFDRIAKENSEVRLQRLFSFTTSFIRQSYTIDFNVRGLIVSVRYILWPSHHNFAVDFCPWPCSASQHSFHFQRRGHEKTVDL